MTSHHQRQPVHGAYRFHTQLLCCLQGARLSTSPTLRAGDLVPGRFIVAQQPHDTSIFIPGCQIIRDSDARPLAAKDDERFFSVNGRNYVMKRLSDRQARKGGVHLASAQDLTAPMPGKVLQVFVQNGDQVETGQPLLILEAMKMEHTIKAHQDGTVVGLNLNEGDQVDLGQVLLDIEPD